MGAALKEGKPNQKAATGANALVRLQVVGSIKMIFKRKKIECVIGPAPNPEMIEFSFHGDHWSLFFPDIKTILEKRLKPCRWEEKTEGEIAYEIGTDDFHHILLCEDGEVYIEDNNYGLSVFIATKDEHLFHRVENALRKSDRFELVFKSNGTVTAGLNLEDAPDRETVR